MFCSTCWRIRVSVSGTPHPRWRSTRTFGSQCTLPRGAGHGSMSGSSEFGASFLFESVSNWTGLVTTMAEVQFHKRKTWLQCRGTALFVYGIWTVMRLAGLAFVVKFGSNVPSWDEWDMVSTMTGEQPVTASWLWSQHNEHRV